MQTAQKLEANATLQKDDAPVTQKDLRNLLVQLSDISDKLEKIRRECTYLNNKLRIMRKHT